MEVLERLREFIENEARSCLMDVGCITPLCDNRYRGGAVAPEEIEASL